MNKDETIDDDLINRSNPKEVILHSKVSIALVFIFLSPFYASYLYGVNLYRVGKSKLIFSSLVTLITCNLVVLVGLLGFDLDVELFSSKIYLQYLISRSITSILILFPIWTRHFKNIKYYTSFNYKIVGILLLIKTLLVLIKFNSFTQLLDFRSTYIIQPPILGFMLIGKVAIDLIRGESFKTRK